MLYLHLGPADGEDQLEQLPIIIDLTLSPNPSTEAHLKEFHHYTITNSELALATLAKLAIVEKFLASPHSLKDSEVEKAVAFLQNPVHKKIMRELYSTEFDKVFESCEQMKKYPKVTSGN